VQIQQQTAASSKRTWRLINIAWKKVLEAPANLGSGAGARSANFSTSGENQQNNDLIVIHDVGAAAKFEVGFHECR
jgi:hypothetical protein